VVCFHGCVFFYWFGAESSVEYTCGFCEDSYDRKIRAGMPVFDWVITG
jgi:hypothetical protein